MQDLEPRVRPATRLAGWPLATLAVAAGVHCLLVASILRQPLDAGRDGHPRSPIAAIHYDGVRRSGPGADFFALYRAGVQASRGASVYHWQETPPVTPYAYDYRYLPILAQTTGRLAILLPPRRAWQAWVLAIEATLAGLLAVFWQAFRDPRWRTGVTCLLLLSTPYFLELHMGQFTFVATALTTMAVLWLAGEGTKGRRVTRAAVAYVAAVVTKIFPLVVVPALARHPRGRRVAGVAAALAVLAAVAGALTDEEFGVRVIRQSLIGGNLGLDAGNHGAAFLSYSIARMADPSLTPRDWVWPARLLRVAVLGVAVVAVLVSRRPPLPGGAAVLLLAHFASFLLLWEHHVSGVLVAGVLLLAAMREQHGAPGLSREMTMAAACLALLALPTPYGLLPPAPSGWQPWMFLVLPASKAVPLTALYVLAVRWVLRGARIQALRFRSSLSSGSL